MAAYETTRTAQGAFGGRLSSFVSGLVAAFAEWNEVRLTRAALAKLSDRELVDIGLSRGDIEYIAKHSRKEA